MRTWLRISGSSISGILVKHQSHIIDSSGFHADGWFCNGDRIEWGYVIDTFLVSC